MTTIIRAVREGKPCQLVQPLSPTGRPKCLQCSRTIPGGYLRNWKGRHGWYCTDACAIAWANCIAGHVYVKSILEPPAAPPAAGAAE